MNTLLLLLAQTTAPAGPPAAPSPPGMGQFLPLALIVGAFAFLMLTSRSQKKREQERRDQMLNNLSKSDRVVTIGGVIGTVASVRDREVVLKTDESTNTKMTFLKTAVQRVVSEDGEDAR